MSKHVRQTILVVVVKWSEIKEFLHTDVRWFEITLNTATLLIVRNDCDTLDVQIDTFDGEWKQWNMRMRNNFYCIYFFTLSVFFIPSLYLSLKSFGLTQVRAVYFEEKFNHDTTQTGFQNSALPPIF